MLKIFTSLLFVLLSYGIYAQDTLTFMQYNLLMYGNNFGGCNSSNNNIMVWILPWVLEIIDSIVWEISLVSMLISFLSLFSFILLSWTINDSKGTPRYLFNRAIIFNVSCRFPLSTSETLVLPPNRGATSTCFKFICSIRNLMASIGEGAPIG